MFYMLVYVRVSNRFKKDYLCTVLTGDGGPRRPINISKVEVPNDAFMGIP